MGRGGGEGGGGGKGGELGNSNEEFEKCRYC